MASREDRGEPAERSSVQLGRSVSGVYFWRIHVRAEGDDAASLQAAAQVAQEIDADLEELYGPVEQRQ
jgi:hypothetical protein